MNHIFKLKNHIKQYDWGSPDWLPQLLGVDNKERKPWAELWMGIHQEGPSEIEYEGAAIGLSELINQEPCRYLGSEIGSRFGTLPFLFKALAAGKPLSIQAHPSLVQAQAGWDRENQAGIPLKASNRNYKDPNHKPEILCALRDFRAMSGFRECPEIVKRLEMLAEFGPDSTQTALGSLSRILTSSDEQPQRLRMFFKALFSLSSAVKRELSVCVKTYQEALVKAHPEYSREWETAAYFAELYPGDPAAIAPLYLNVIDLRPGQAIYIPAGILHAYISGFGVELMANSDNVLRGGLTSKHIDLEELLHILDFTPFNPEILNPQGTIYPTSCKEFTLSVMTGLNNNPLYCHTKAGPAIVLVTQGTLTIRYLNSSEVCVLKQGESAFISALDAQEFYVFQGDCTLYAATVGDCAL
jgi:mannose-6-phosphate isomerase